MAAAWSHIVPRDSDDGSPLSKGAIAGISCGAAILFLGSIGLFFIYYRRQKRFDRQDDLYGDYDDEDVRTTAGKHLRPHANPVFTMDYKMDQESVGSTYAHSPEIVKSQFSHVASAMPAHPAYIPRAVVRGKTTPSITSSPPGSGNKPRFSSATKSSTRSDEKRAETVAMQTYLSSSSPDPDRQQRTGTSTGASSVPRTTFFPSPRLDDDGADDTDITAPGYYSSDNAYYNSSSNNDNFSKPSNHLNRMTRPAPIVTSANERSESRRVPALVISNTSSTASSPDYFSKPQQNYTVATSADATITAFDSPLPLLPRAPPPKLSLLTTAARSDKPISGLEDMTISGPLAFPSHHHHHHRTSFYNEHSDEQLDNAAADPYSATAEGPSSRRAFRDRDREVDGGGGGARHVNNRARNGSRTGTGARAAGSRIAAAARGGDNPGGGDTQNRRHSNGNRHYAEIEVGRGSDIW